MELLRIINLSVTIDDKKTILKNIDLSLCSGDVLCISGDNGSGKSTLLKVILGELPGFKVDGKIVFKNDKNLLAEKDIQWFKRLIAYVPQEDTFACDTPFEELMYSYKLHTGEEDSSYINSIFEKFGLEHLKNKKLYGKNGAQLSGGEKKMISLLSALCRKNAELFLIDEPLNNLDAKNVRTINNIIAEIHNNNPESGIILVTHCHALSSITEQYEIANGNIEKTKEKYKCFNCFGDVDSKGYYKV